MMAEIVSYYYARYHS